MQLVRFTRHLRGRKTARTDNSNGDYTSLRSPALIELLRVQSSLLPALRLEPVLHADRDREVHVRLGVLCAVIDAIPGNHGVGCDPKDPALPSGSDRYARQRWPPAPAGWDRSPLPKAADREGLSQSRRRPRRPWHARSARRACCAVPATPAADKQIFVNKRSLNQLRRNVIAGSCPAGSHISPAAAFDSPMPAQPVRARQVQTAQVRTLQGSDRPSYGRTPFPAKHRTCCRTSYWPAGRQRCRCRCRWFARRCFAPQAAPG